MNSSKHRLTMAQLNKKVLAEQTYEIAAKAVRSDCLSKIYIKTDNQQSIRSTVINEELEKVEEFLSICGRQMIKLLKMLKEDE